MWCPRLDHYVRFNSNGSLSRCGHMIDPPAFNSLEDMENSQWLKGIKDKFLSDEWPAECYRCKQTEEINGSSIRLNSINASKKETIPNYLQIGGILDNICNSACQSCGAFASTKIGSLTDKKSYLIVDNSNKFWNLPQDRILMLDINGGEPSTSSNYKRLLSNLPPNLKTLRVNTNGSRVITELNKISQQGVEVTVTVSFDGIGLVHDYVRWPIKWAKFEKTILAYKKYNLNLNFWTTVHALNINDLENVFNYVDTHKLNHSYALLDFPKELNVAYKNKLTTAAKEKYANSNNLELRKLSEKLAIGIDNEVELNAFISKQDKLRNIDIANYIDY